jgi:hypothetical protein
MADDKDHNPAGQANRRSEISATEAAALADDLAKLSGQAGLAAQLIRAMLRQAHSSDVFRIGKA